MKCKACGHWNRFEVNKVLIEQVTSEPKVKAFIPMYELFKIETYNKCKNIIVKPKELIRIIQSESK